MNDFDKILESVFGSDFSQVLNNFVKGERVQLLYNVKYQAMFGTEPLFPFFSILYLIDSGEIEDMDMEKGVDKLLDITENLFIKSIEDNEKHKYEITCVAISELVLALLEITMFQKYQGEREKVKSTINVSFKLMKHLIETYDDNVNKFVNNMVGKLNKFHGIE